MSRRLLGLVCFSVGLGMILAILVPAFGWVLVAGIGLVYLGYYMSKQCK